MPCSSTIAKRKRMLKLGGPGRLCGSRLAKHPGRYCRRKATAGHWRCHHHGSKSTGPRPRFDAEGNRIVPNLEARNAGLKRWLERKRMIRDAIILAALKEGLAKGMKPWRIAKAHHLGQEAVYRVAKRYSSSCA